MKLPLVITFALFVMMLASCETSEHKRERLRGESLFLLAKEFGADSQWTVNLSDTSWKIEVQNALDLQDTSASERKFIIMASVYDAAFDRHGQCYLMAYSEQHDAVFRLNCSRADVESMLVWKNKLGPTFDSFLVFTPIIVGRPLARATAVADGDDLYIIEIANSMLVIDGNLLKFVVINDGKTNEE